MAGLRVALLAVVLGSLLSIALLAATEHTGNTHASHAVSTASMHYTTSAEAPDMQGPVEGAGHCTPAEAVHLREPWVAEASFALKLYILSSSSSGTSVVSPFSVYSAPEMLCLCRDAVACFAYRSLYS